MMAAQFEGEDFGQESPPLYRYIAKILQEYPSGQIFKVQIIIFTEPKAKNELKCLINCM